MNTMLKPISLLTSAACLLSVATCFANGAPPAIALPVPAQEGVQVVAHASPATAPVACCTPDVVYRHAHLFRRCNYGQTAKTTLIVEDKCSSSCYAIPVCIPVCCLDEACVGERCGLLGRRVIVYTWKCGYKLEIIMRLRGDVLVVYHD